MVIIAEAPTELAPSDHKMHPDDRRQCADLILCTHLANGSAIDWSWRALPSLNHSRHCPICRELWPCTYVQWAPSVKAQDLPTWSL